jgi:hypothetical protein
LVFLCFLNVVPHNYFVANSFWRDMADGLGSQTLKGKYPKRAMSEDFHFSAEEGH